MKKGSMVIMGILIALTLGMMTPSSGHGAAEETIILIGTVSPPATFTDEVGQAYSVEQNAAAEELFKDQGQKVIVTGVVTEASGDRRLIVHSHQLWTLPGGSEKGKASDE